MLIDLAQPLKNGERFAVRLRFERAGELDIELEVREAGSRHSGH
jgi:copper(I)-binding protein